MQFTKTFFALATLLAVASAATTLQRRIADPGNPANLVNCEPGGGADDCHLEQPVSHSSLSPLRSSLMTSSLVQPHSYQLRFTTGWSLYLVQL